MAVTPDDPILSQRTPGFTPLGPTEEGQSQYGDILAPQGGISRQRADAFKEWLEKNSKSLEWYFGLRPDQRAEVVAVWWTPDQTQEDYKPGKDPYARSKKTLTDIGKQSVQKSFIHDPDFMASIFTPLDASLPGVFGDEKQRQEQGLPAPTDSALPEDIAKEIAKEAEDLTYKNLLDVDEMFIPPVYQPLNSALIRQFADRVGADILGRQLTREEKARAVSLFRGIEKEQYQYRKQLSKFELQAEMVQKAMLETGTTAPDLSAATATITKQLGLSDPQLAQQTQDLQLPENATELTGAVPPEEIQKARKVLVNRAEAGIPAGTAEETAAQFQEELVAQETFEHPWQALGTQLRRLITSMRSNQQGGVI